MNVSSQMIRLWLDFMRSASCDKITCGNKQVYGQLTMIYRDLKSLSFCKFSAAFPSVCDASCRCFIDLEGKSDTWVITNTDKHRLTC